MLSTNQRYKIECNSQLTILDSLVHLQCCLQIKDTKLNAIHNASDIIHRIQANVVYKSKIQN